MRLPATAMSTPFQIGLKPLAVADWLDVDDQLCAYLTEKQRLDATHRAEIFAAEQDTEAAQAEFLALLLDHLAAHHPETHRRDGDTMRVGPHRVDLRAIPALLAAGLLVQDDFVLMRRGETGWRLAAASLSFPSSWRLADKFGRPMHEVHGPVPGFAAGTRNAELITRMFDNMRPETPMLRWNWSLFSDMALHHPEPNHPVGPRFGVRGEKAVLRLERQTLRRLPGTGDIVFAIRIYVDPLDGLERHPDGRTLAAALIDKLEALTPEQAAYKGLATDRHLLTARLRTLAGA